MLGKGMKNPGPDTIPGIQNAVGPVWRLITYQLMITWAIQKAKLPPAI